MKLWEVLRELHEDPKKKFENDLGNVIGFYDGVLSWLPTKDNNRVAHFIAWDERSGLDGNVISTNVGDIWHELKQPVSWQEALEAWINGKRVVCKLNEDTYSYHISRLLLVDQDANALSDSEIQRGTWYIED